MPGRIDGYSPGPLNGARRDGGWSGSARATPIVASMAADTSAELVRRCLAGEARAWDELVDRFSRLVYSVPRRYGLSSSDAEDVMQAVFVAAYQSLARINDPARLSAWLITSAHRESWRVGRQRGAIAANGALIGASGGRGLEHAILDVGAPPDEMVERWETQDRVGRALAELGGRCEDLLRALYFRRAEGNYDAIATELGIPIGSIGPTRARCLRKLEEILRADPAAGDLVCADLSRSPPSAQRT